MRVRSRRLTIVVAASYLLVVTASAQFHRHGHRDQSPVRSGVSASHSDDDGECSICQFLAQKPAPAANLPPVTLSTLVREVFLPAPMHSATGAFTAWHSRGPPHLA